MSDWTYNRICSKCGLHWPTLKDALGGVENCEFPYCVGSPSISAIELADYMNKEITKYANDL
jgi:hypothetical protein